MKIFVIVLSLGSFMTFDFDIVLPCLLIAGFVLTSIDMKRSGNLKDVDML